MHFGAAPLVVVVGSQPEQGDVRRHKTAEGCRDGTSEMKQLVAAIERRIGVAFENRDGSCNLRFDFIPAGLESTTVQLRDFEVKEKEQKEAA